MKLLFMHDKEFGVHKKLRLGIKLMCDVYNISLIISSDKTIIFDQYYDIIYLSNIYIHPSELPKTKIIYGNGDWIGHCLNSFHKNSDIFLPIDRNEYKNCIYNSSSLWVKNTISSLFNVTNFIKIKHFPFPIDLVKFDINKNVKKDIDCLVYFKNINFDIFLNIKNILDKKIINYKIYNCAILYNEDDYILDLHKSKFMLVIDGFETQGFALQEAMACNVPLLVYNCETIDNMEGYLKNFLNELEKWKNIKIECTSVPYWSNDCGIITNNLNDLSDSIDYMKNNYKNFFPRNFILNTLSPKICIDNLLNS